jgi:hypothetical protein
MTAATDTAVTMNSINLLTFRKKLLLPPLGTRSEPSQQADAFATADYFLLVARLTFRH